jgi:hypothetical protein
VIFLGALIAGFIYAFAVFQAATQRSHPSHVHPHSSN